MVKVRTVIRTGNRLTIPKKVMEELGLQVGDFADIETDKIDDFWLKMHVQFFLGSRTDYCVQKDGKTE